NRVIIIKFYLSNFRFKSNIYTFSLEFVRHCFVKICSRYLPSPIPPISKFIAEVKNTDFLTFDKTCSEFWLKLIRIQSIEQSGFFKMVHYTRNQTFAYNNTRKFLLFYHFDFGTFLLKISCGYTSRRSCSDDKDINIFCIHMN